MIELTQSVPIFTTQEKEAFSHNQAVFSALQVLRSYGFTVSYPGVEAPDCPNDDEFEKKYPGMSVKRLLDEINS